jgi:hypothetical protein
MPPNPQTLAARIVKGHRVASGLNGNPRFPGGTMRMQIPYFLALGLDLRSLYPGTLNVSIAPKRYRVVSPRYSFPALKWHPVEPAEDFSFFDARLVRPGNTAVEGFVYYPHPETKPEHFQSPDVLELLFPRVEGLEYGMEIELEVPAEQMVFE